MWQALRGPLLVALALRLVLVVLVAPEQQRVFNSDSYEFERLARNLLDRGELTRDTAPPYRPESVRTPLFPGLVAALYATFGRAYAVVLVVNALLAGGACAVLALADRRRGPLAALLYAVDPTSVVYSTLFVAETLFTLLLLVGVVLLAKALESASPRRASGLLLAAGLGLGLGVLAKPAATYLPPVLLGAALLVRGRRVGMPRAVLLVGLGYLAAVGPWLARNHALLGVYETSAIQEVNLFYWNVAVLEGGLHGRDYRSAEAELRAEARSRAGRPLEDLEPGERARLLRGLSLEKIRAHPVRYAWVHARGALATLADPGRLDFARLLGGRDWSFGFLSVLTEHGVGGVLAALLERPPALVGLLVLTLGWLVLLYASAGCGLLRVGRELPREPLLVLAAAAIAYLAIIGGPIGNARFRVPLVPYVALFAAAAHERFAGRPASA